MNYKSLILDLNWELPKTLSWSFTEDVAFEPPHDKTNKVTVRPAKTQISLGIHPVWSESLLYA